MSCHVASAESTGGSGDGGGRRRRRTESTSAASSAVSSSRDFQTMTSPLPSLPPLPYQQPSSGAMSPLCCQSTSPLLAGTIDRGGSSARSVANTSSLACLRTRSTSARGSSMGVGLRPFAASTRATSRGSGGASGPPGRSSLPMSSALLPGTNRYSNAISSRTALSMGSGDGDGGGNNKSSNDVSSRIMLSPGSFAGGIGAETSGEGSKVKSPTVAPETRSSSAGGMHR